MTTVVIEIDKGLVTAFRADSPDVRLLVLDQDGARIGEDPATLLEKPGHLKKADRTQVNEILKAHRQPARNRR